MPRGGRRSSPSPSRAAPRRAAPRRAAPPPQLPAPVAQQPSMVGQPMSGGGSIMRNIATTAAGVAIGHTVGHAITGAISGGDHGGSEVAAASAAAAAPVPLSTEGGNYQRPIGGGYCEQEFQQFIRCTQEQSDISLCTGYNELLKDCKLRHKI